MQSNLSTFSFLACPSGVISKEILAKPSVRKFLPCVFFKVFIIPCLTFRSLIHLKLRCWVRAQLHCFPYGYPVKRLSFSIQWSWNLCQKSFYYTCKGLSLGSLSYSIVTYVCIHAITTLFCYCSIVVKFEMRKCESSHFVLLKTVLVMWGPLRFHMNLRMGFSVSAKESLWDFDTDCK